MSYLKLAEMIEIDVIEMKTETYKEFSAKLRHKNPPVITLPKVTGMRFLYRKYIKYKPNAPQYVLNESKFQRIVTRINEIVLNQILAGNTIKLPFDFGDIAIVNKKVSPRLKDGKLIYNAPVDWGATIKLWYEDEEAKAQKLLVKYDIQYLYRFHYSKVRARYTHKGYVIFRPQRDAKVRLKNLVVEDKILCRTYDYGPKIYKHK